MPNAFNRIRRTVVVMVAVVVMAAMVAVAAAVAAVMLAMAIQQLCVHGRRHFDSDGYGQIS